MQKLLLSRVSLEENKPSLLHRAFACLCHQCLADRLEFMRGERRPAAASFPSQNSACRAWDCRWPGHAWGWSLTQPPRGGLRARVGLSKLHQVTANCWLSLLPLPLLFSVNLSASSLLSFSMMHFSFPSPGPLRGPQTQLGAALIKISVLCDLCLFPSGFWFAFLFIMAFHFKGKHWEHKRVYFFVSLFFFYFKCFKADLLIYSVSPICQQGIGWTKSLANMTRSFWKLMIKSERS